MSNNPERPLADEAAKRREWRGDGADAPKPEAEGHTLPASEDDDERMKGRGGQIGAAPPLSTISPPD
ncbi:MAG TPA: hypothetical protein VGD10_02610 [Allosphingosinicella sp.]|uniref:hypothetical protein n=1 Tax=Allosphingosinicella sp. TaxID=2823234 RepID=UPI002ED95306